MTTQNNIFKVKTYVQIQPENECIECECIEYQLSFIKNPVNGLKFDSTVASSVPVAYYTNSRST